MLQPLPRVLVYAIVPTTILPAGSSAATAATELMLNRKAPSQFGWIIEFFFDTHCCNKASYLLELYQKATLAREASCERKMG